MPHATSHAPTARALLPDAWPVLLLFGLYPLWWFLGLGGFVWGIFALPMLLWLFRRRSVDVPIGFGFWLLFLSWMAASLLVIDDSGRLMVAIHRASLYVSATILFVYVYDLPLPALRKVVGALATFWAGVVALGLLAVLWPSLEFTSLMERVLPRGLLSSGYILELTHVRLAQIHDFLGFPVGRPTGPFAYTNQWGSAFALLTPFAMLAVKLRLYRWRWLIPLAVLAPVPLVVSLDRGAWLS